MSSRFVQIDTPTLLLPPFSLNLEWAGLFPFQDDKTEAHKGRAGAFPWVDWVYPLLSAISGPGSDNEDWSGLFAVLI